MKTGLVLMILVWYHSAEGLQLKPLSSYNWRFLPKYSRRRTELTSTVPITTPGCLQAFPGIHWQLAMTCT